MDKNSYCKLRTIKARGQISNLAGYQRLNSLVGDLNIRINKFVAKESDQLELPDYCYSDFMSFVSQAIDAFEHIYKYDPFFNDTLFEWALCFDELELAPWLFEMIYETKLRSVNQKVLSKLTATPDTNIDYGSHRSKMSPSNREDFATLKLWVYDRPSQDNWRTFCEDYAKALLKKRFDNLNISPIQILGKQDLDNAIVESEGGVFRQFTKKDGELYNRNGVAYEVFKRLADNKNEKSFYMYLSRKGINPLDPVPVKKEQIPSIYRKIKPIVYYRFYFKKETTRIEYGQKRSRKIVSFNYGRDFIYDIADGNPRVFVHLINKLIQSIKFEKGTARPLTINEQARIVKDFCEAYLYPKIVFYPDSTVRYNGKIFSLKDIIDSIGHYFYRRLIEEDFSADPYNLFWLDDDLPIQLKKIFDAALEAGGIVKIEDSADKKVRIKMREQKNIYRLSYSLYPYFNIPKQDYNIIPVSRIVPYLSDTQLKLEI